MCAIHTKPLLTIDSYCSLRFCNNRGTKVIDISLLFLQGFLYFLYCRVFLMHTYLIFLQILHHSMCHSEWDPLGSLLCVGIHYLSYRMFNAVAEVFLLVILWWLGYLQGAAKWLLTYGSFLWVKAVLSFFPEEDY